MPAGSDDDVLAAVAAQCLFVFTGPQRIDIREILETSGRALVSQKRISTYERHIVAATSTDNAAGPRIIPIDARNTAHDVNLDRLDPHLQHPVAVNQVVWAQLIRRETKGGDCSDGGACVLEGGSNQDVEITGVARCSVKGESVGSHDHELNAVSDQRIDELVEVGREIH